MGILLGSKRRLLMGFWLALAVGTSGCGRTPVVAPAEPITTPPATEELAPTEGQNAGQWDSPPPFLIEMTKVYIARLETEKGEIVVELFADRAPITVNNFVFLARQGFYDDTSFHRVIHGFMAQGGDPTGTGTGGPGYTFQDEFDPSLRFDQEGLLAMANSGPNTNGSQFFITYGPTPWLNGFHTIFGKVVEGMDVLRALTPRDPQESPTTPGDRLIHVEIEEVEQSLLPTPTATPHPNAPVLESGRPLAALEVGARENLYNTMPAMVLSIDASYTAQITTTKGTILVELYPLSAPRSVNNFIVLAKLGYWDNFPINRVQEGAFVLTGSPSGRPDSDIGYSLPSEAALPMVKGAVGFWYRQDLQASSGSQFFILLDDLVGMEEYFTVFGNVTQGQWVADQLTEADRVVRVTIIER